MKKVSVIIPCYNAVRWLPQCFLSLAQQTIGIDSLELIFVNDASTDEGATWGLLTEFERAYPESVLIIDLPQNRRQGGARNEALQYASGEYLAFVDADDWVDVTLFEKVYCCAKENDADIVQFQHQFYFEQAGLVNNPAVMQSECIRMKTPEDRKRLLLSEKFTYGCWNKLYRKQMVDAMQVRFAEQVIYEEPLFVYPLLFAADCFVTLPEPLYIYRQNHTGTMRSDMKERKTLLQHAQVQLLTWNFMKETAYFHTYYEEIKLYFLHTYLYEFLVFAKNREIPVDLSVFEPLVHTALAQVGDITQSAYSALQPKQMELYRLAAAGLTEETLRQYIRKLS